MGRGANMELLAGYSDFHGNDAVAVYEVIDQINSVKDAGYSAADKERIDVARTSYTALTKVQKEMFPENTLEMLANIETAYPVMGQVLKVTAHLCRCDCQVLDQFLLHTLNHLALTI